MRNRLYGIPVQFVPKIRKEFLGPFTQKLNEAMLEQYRIVWLVTKDGGGPGGFQEKLAAARNTGARLVLVERPAGGGENMDTVLSWIKEGLSCR